MQREQVILGEVVLTLTVQTYLIEATLVALHHGVIVVESGLNTIVGLDIQHVMVSWGQLQQIMQLLH